MKTKSKLNELGFNLLPQLLYSPSLTPSNCWLFNDLQNMLLGKRFGSNEEVIAITEAYFVAKVKSFYKHGIEKLKKVLKRLYHIRRRWCRWIKMNFVKQNIVFLVSPGTYWTIRQKNSLYLKLCDKILISKRSLHIFIERSSNVLLHFNQNFDTLTK